MEDSKQKHYLLTHRPSRVQYITTASSRVAHRSLVAVQSCTSSVSSCQLPTSDIIKAIILPSLQMRCAYTYVLYRYVCRHPKIQVFSIILLYWFDPSTYYTNVVGCIHKCIIYFHTVQNALQPIPYKCILWTRV
jgi:hypothetical protein